MATHQLEIRDLRATDARALGEFFAEAEADKATRSYFHPHPLSRGYAVELCNRVDRIKDRYFALFVGEAVAGYGMLRGWDEGFDIPSFGVCVHPKLQGTGIGHTLTSYAIEESRRAGAKKLRLSVYKRNERAVHLYEKYGFDFSEKDDQSLVGMKDLTKDVPLPSRPLDDDKLQEWAQQRAQRPFRVGIWAAYSATLTPSAGIGVFVYNLIDGLLVHPDQPEIVLSIRHGDHHLVADQFKKWEGRVRIIPEADPEPEPEPGFSFSPSSILAGLVFATKGIANMAREYLVAPARAVADRYPFVVLPALPLALTYTYLKEILRPTLRVMSRLERYTIPPPPPEREPLDLHADARRSLCDVWIYPYYGVGFDLSDHASVVFVHDMVPSRYPEYFRAQDVRDLEHVITRRVQEATYVASMSEYIRQNDVIGLLGVAESRAKMVRPTSPTDFAEPAEIEDLLLSDRPYLFYPAGLRGYKNHMLLIEALNLLADDEGEAPFDLIFTGGGEPHFAKPITERAHDLGLGEHVTILGNVSREQLAGLYKSAFATIVPSLYEQGSFPLYEAMHYGCAIASSDIPSLREQCDGLGEAMVYFDPLDPESVAAALRRLQSDHDAIQAAQLAMSRQVWRRTWPQIAEQWLKIFRGAAEEYHVPRKMLTRRTLEPNHRIRIGVFLDFNGTLPPHEGIGVHVHSLLQGFLDQPEDIELVILGRWGQEDVLSSVVRRAPDRVRLVPESHQRLANWESIAENAGCHLWILPYLGTTWRPRVPMATILHDYVIASHPEAFDHSFIHATEQLTKSAIEASQAIICLTETLAEKEARKLLKVPEEKIRVIRPANPRLPTDGKPCDERVLAGLKRPFLFYPSAFRGYKNHAALLHALRLFREEHGENPFDIVFTGPSASLPEDLALIPGMDGLKGQVHVLGRVSRATLEGLYERAFAMVFPSKYEGCGLPLYEAIDKGCPVVCSDLPVFREQLAEFEDSILYFRADQPRTLVRALYTLRERRGEILAAQQLHRDSLLSRSWADVATDWINLARELATDEVPSLTTQSRGVAVKVA